MSELAGHRPPTLTGAKACFFCGLKADDHLLAWCDGCGAVGLYGQGDDWVRLPKRLPVEVGDVLMVREPYADHPRTQSLCNQLIDHIAQLAAQHPDVVLHRKPVAYVV